MRTMTTGTWTRRGVNFLWDEEAFGKLAEPSSVLSLRAGFRLSSQWADELPANDGRTLVVAGLDACMDQLPPGEAGDWVLYNLRPFIQAFQAEFDGEGSLVFWIPRGKQRIKMNAATEEYSWHCAPPYNNKTLPIGRLLWSGAEPDIERIMKNLVPGTNLDGPDWIGLHHPRIS